MKNRASIQRSVTGLLMKPLTFSFTTSLMASLQVSPQRSYMATLGADWHDLLNLISRSEHEIKPSWGG